MKRRGCMGIFIGLIFLFLVIGFAGYQYLRGEALPKHVSKYLESKHDIRGQFTPLKWDGLQVQTDEYQGFGGSGHTDLALDLKKVEAKASLSALLLRRTFLVDRVKMEKLTLRYRKKKTAESKPKLPSASEVVSDKAQKTNRKKAFKSNVQVRSVEINEFNLVGYHGPAPLTIEGLNLKASPSGDFLFIEGQGGVFNAKAFPTCLIKTLKGSVKNKVLTLEEAELVTREGEGSVKILGKFEQEPRRFDVDIALKKVPVNSLQSVGQMAGVAGLLDGSLKVVGEPGSGVKVTGPLNITDGKLIAGPLTEVLNAIAMGTGSTPKSFIGRLDVIAEGKTVTLENIDLFSDQAWRVEGNLMSEAGMAEGTLNVGLHESRVKLIPKVVLTQFSNLHENHYWITVPVSGPVDKLAESIGKNALEKSAKVVKAQGGEIGEILLDKAEDIIKDIFK